MANNNKAKDTVSSSTSIDSEELATTKKWLKKPILVKVVIFILIILLLVIAIKKLHHNNSAFVIDHTSYSKQFISNMASFATLNVKESKQQAAKNIFVLYENEIASKQVGIIPTSAEIQAQNIVLPTPKNSTERQYVALVKYNAALSDAYGYYMQGNDQGYYFVFNFSRYIVSPPAQSKAIPNHGNASSIQQDNAYAYLQAQTEYKAYKAGKITASNLLSKISSDPNLTYDSPGGYFNSSIKNVSLYNQIDYTSAYQYIAAQTKPQLSGIRVGQVPTSYSGSPDYVNGYYYFVDLKKASKIITNPSGLVSGEINKLQAVYYGL
jgi:hypothetical protein